MQLSRCTVLFLPSFVACSSHGKALNDIGSLSVKHFSEKDSTICKCCPAERLNPMDMMNTIIESRNKKSVSFLIIAENDQTGVGCDSRREDIG